jgi:hypothetical protein
MCHAIPSSALAIEVFTLDHDGKVIAGQFISPQA